jgi:hypothetical protein
VNVGSSSWHFILAVFVYSRLLFLGVGVIAVEMLPWANPATRILEPSGSLNYWAHWDGAWYSEVATEGYEANAPHRTAFFPSFPMLVYIGTSLGIGTALWGVLVSLVATVFALYFLFRIAEKLRDARAARATVLALSFFPTAFFLNAVYAEALFLALTTGSFWAAYVRRDLLLAGALGALAAATRNFGVLLLIPLLYEWLRNKQEFGWRGLWEIALVPTGLLGYMIFLQGRFGDPSIFLHQQGAYWHRELTNPVVTMERAWVGAGKGLHYVLDPATLFLERSRDPALDASNTLNLAFLVLLLALLAIGFAVLPRGLSVYAFLVTLLPVLTPADNWPLMSLPRFMLGAFPLFLVLGYLLARSRPALYLWLFVSASLGAALTSMFVTWRWVA